jgi:pimeloyl-ACP methyl ester carboxylesterase
MLIHGLNAPARTMAPMARWLTTGGWVTSQAQIGANVGCSQRHVNRLAGELEESVRATGERALVVGQSRGGLLGRALAVQRPDLVAMSIAMGAPVLDQFAAHAYTLANVQVLSLLGTLGVRGFMSHGCEHGPCCAAYRDALASAPRHDVSLVSIYSPSDGMIDPAACVDPHATCREVDSSHLGMGVNVEVWRVISEVLAGDEVNEPTVVN